MVLIVGKEGGRGFFWAFVLGLLPYGLYLRYLCLVVHRIGSLRFIRVEVAGELEVVVLDPAHAIFLGQPEFICFLFGT